MTQIPSRMSEIVFFRQSEKHEREESYVGWFKFFMFWKYDELSYILIFIIGILAHRALTDEDKNRVCNEHISFQIT